jgi:hypothetical protein
MPQHHAAALSSAQAGAVVVLTFAVLGVAVLITSAFAPIRF